MRVRRKAFGSRLPRFPARDPLLPPPPAHYSLLCIFILHQTRAIHAGILYTRRCFPDTVSPTTESRRRIRLPPSQRAPRYAAATYSLCNVLNDRENTRLWGKKPNLSSTFCQCDYRHGLDESFFEILESFFPKFWELPKIEQIR